jgi:hypothetical protein
MLRPLSIACTISEDACSRQGPFPVTEAPRLFDDAEWFFEFKYDGLRALAYLERGLLKALLR